MDIPKKSKIRFWSKVDKKTSSRGCWLWRGGQHRQGYGQCTILNTQWRAHRLSWILHGNLLKKNLTLDHLCRNEACVNPKHLEQVTMRENLLRRKSIQAKNARKKRCKRGHFLSGTNLLGATKTKTGGALRRCRKCAYAYYKKWNKTKAGKAYFRKWVAINKDKVRQYQHKYRTKCQQLNHAK